MYPFIKYLSLLYFTRILLIVKRFFFVKLRRGMRRLLRKLRKLCRYCKHKGAMCKRHFICYLSENSVGQFLKLIELLHTRYSFWGYSYTPRYKYLVMVVRFLISITPRLLFRTLIQMDFIFIELAGYYYILETQSIFGLETDINGNFRFGGGSKASGGSAAAGGVGAVGAVGGGDSSDDNNKTSKDDTKSNYVVAKARYKPEIVKPGDLAKDLHVGAAKGVFVRDNNEFVATHPLFIKLDLVSRFEEMKLFIANLFTHHTGGLVSFTCSDDKRIMLMRESEANNLLKSGPAIPRNHELPMPGGKTSLLVNNLLNNTVAGITPETKLYIVKDDNWLEVIANYGNILNKLTENDKEAGSADGALLSRIKEEEDVGKRAEIYSKSISSSSCISRGLGDFKTFGLYVQKVWRLTPRDLQMMQNEPIVYELDLLHNGGKLKNGNGYSNLADSLHGLKDSSGPRRVLPCPVSEHSALPSGLMKNVGYTKSCNSMMADCGKGVFGLENMYNKIIAYDKCLETVTRLVKK